MICNVRAFTKIGPGEPAMNTTTVQCGGSVYRAERTFTTECLVVINIDKFMYLPTRNPPS